MAGGHQKLESVTGQAQTSGGSLSFEVVRAAPHSLVVAFADGSKPPPHSEIEGIELQLGNQSASLSRCRFVPHPDHPRRRKSDPPDEPGDGRLNFLDEVYDFTNLFREANIVVLNQKIEQLTLVWNRKRSIAPAFRAYAADLVYDLQVYRALFDAIDRNLESEPPETRARVHRVTLELGYPDFTKFLDKTVDGLKEVVAPFSRREHAQHGFYFRKQVWDMILASKFLSRTNLKPRGYAGDSMMMRYLYDNGYLGDTVFAKMMHHYPMQTAAAQAVRNRRVLIAEWVREMIAEQGASADEPFRMMSIACGSASELNEIVATPEDVGKTEIVLLDQDRDALAEAEETLRVLNGVHGRDLNVRTERDSVRVMLRTPKLSDKFGRFHCVYAMGLFDYLAEPVARAVIAKMYEMVMPGGHLIVGNFHIDNPTRVYMDYWADWVLYYRTEQELLELTAGLDGADGAVEFESAGAQIFLKVQKRG